MTKKLLLLSTGGTIASVASDSGLVPKESGEELIKLLGQLPYEIEVRDILQLDSSNIQPEEWKFIAKKVYEYRNDYYRFGTFKGKAVNEEFGFEASPRLDWGGTASVGIAVKRISFTIGYDLAWGKYNKEQNDLRIRNHMVSFISGYTF